MRGCSGCAARFVLLADLLLLFGWCRFLVAGGFVAVALICVGRADWLCWAVLVIDVVGGCTTGVSWCIGCYAQCWSDACLVFCCVGFGVWWLIAVV